MATATQIVTLSEDWTLIATAKGRDAMLMVDAYGMVQLAIADGERPTASLAQGHQFSGPFLGQVRGAEVVWARGAGLQVAVTLLQVVTGYDATASARAAIVAEQALAVANEAYGDTAENREASEAAQAAAQASAAQADAAAGQAEVAAEDLRNVEQGELLTDGGADVMTLDTQGALIRMYDDGLDLLPGRALTNRVFDNGTEAGDLGSDLGAVIEALDGVPIRKLYSDGHDFIPSARFIDRFRAAGLGGGGLTADGWATSPDGTFTAQAGQHGVLAVDRFEDRGDGVRVPVVVINGQTRKAIIISVYGQSNANVTPMGDPLFWDTPPFPYHAFMLDDMNTGPNKRGGMMGWQGVTVSRGTRMVNASEIARETQDYASAAFARLIMMDGPIRRAGLIRSSAWGGQALIGPSAGLGIWKDSTGAYTSSWANWTGDIQQAYDLLTAEGFDVDKIYICFTHQEEDWQTARATYLSQFLGMKADREAICTAAFPGVPVHWFVDQASGSGLRTPKYMGGAWPDRMAIYDATLPGNGGDNITMAMPRYWMTFGLTTGGVLEDIHHSYRSRVWQGEMYAHAMHAVEMGQEWRCPSATVSGNDVIVDFDSIEPLVIDPTFCKVRPDMGFVIGNGAVVTGVRLTGQRQVTVSCATAPATSISYAYRTQDINDVADIWPISTGAIRDAWEAPSAFDPGKKLVRAALGFQLTL